MPQNDETFEYGDLFADFFGGPRRRPAQIERLPVPEPKPEQPKQKQVQAPPPNERKTVNNTVGQGANSVRYPTEDVVIDQRSSNNRDQRSNQQQPARDQRSNQQQPPRDTRDTREPNRNQPQKPSQPPRREEPEDYDDTTDNFFNRHRS